MMDRVLYRLPMGAMGKGLAGWKVKSDISEIFQYRRKRIAQLFGN
jgi:ligand-binding SRPBCC domain-containing protein